MALNCLSSTIHEDQERLLQYEPPTQNDMVAYLPKPCIVEILKNLEYYEPFLHPLILTNRHWCREVMPYLWQRPFSRAATAFADQNILARFFGSYLWECKDLKKMSKLFTNFIEFPTHAPSFQYVKFLKEFAPLTIIQIIATVIPAAKFRKIQKTSKLLFRHIFTSGTTLRHFVLSFPKDVSLLETILKNDPGWDLFQYPGGPHSLETLRSLECDFICHPPLLQSAYTVLRNLTRLDVNMERYESFDSSQDRATNLVHLIRAQTNLKYFRLGYCSGKAVNIILMALQSQKETLEKIVFYKVDFWNCQQIFDILCTLQKVSSVNFLYCERLRGCDGTNKKTNPYPHLEEILLQQTIMSQHVLEDFAKRTHNTLKSVKLREHRFAGSPDEFSLLVTSIFEKYNVRVVNGP